MNNETNLKKNNTWVFLVIIMLLVIIIVILLLGLAKKNDKDSNDGEVSKEEAEAILQEKKEQLVNNINYYIQETIVANNNYDLGSLTGSEILYYIPVSNIDDNSCIDIENKKGNPFGEWEQAYVAVSYDDTNYSFNYYFTFNDDSGKGMVLTEKSKIKEDGSQIITPIPNPATNSNITKQLDAITKSTIVFLTPAEAQQAGVEACSIKTAKAG